MGPSTGSSRRTFCNGRHRTPLPAASSDARVLLLLRLLRHRSPLLDGRGELRAGEPGQVPPLQLVAMSGRPTLSMIRAPHGHCGPQGESESAALLLVGCRPVCPCRSVLRAARSSRSVVGHGCGPMGTGGGARVLVIVTPGASAAAETEWAAGRGTPGHPVPRRRVASHRDLGWAPR